MSILVTSAGYDPPVYKTILFIVWLDFNEIIHPLRIRRGELYTKESLGTGFQLCGQGMTPVQALWDCVA